MDNDKSERRKKRDAARERRKDGGVVGTGNGREQREPNEPMVIDVPQIIERRVRTDSGLFGLDELNLVDQAANWNRDKLYPIWMTHEELKAVVAEQGGNPTYEQKALLICFAGMASEDESIAQKAVDTFAKLAKMNQTERLRRLELLYGQKKKDEKTGDTYNQFNGNVSVEVQTAIGMEPEYIRWLRERELRKGSNPVIVGTNGHKSKILGSVAHPGT